MRTALFVRFSWLPQPLLSRVRSRRQHARAVSNLPALRTRHLIGDCFVNFLYRGWGRLCRRSHSCVTCSPIRSRGRVRGPGNRLQRPRPVLRFGPRQGGFSSWFRPSFPPRAAAQPGGESVDGKTGQRRRSSRPLGFELVCKTASATCDTPDTYGSSALRRPWPRAQML